MIFATGMLLLVAMLNRQSAAIHMPSVKSENYNSGGLKTVAETGLHVERVNKPPPVNASDQFIQTMGATFAHLQIGIAVFDKNNELSLFNPALSQYLGLRPEWLLEKPNLPGFLDRLRDTHILPEPENYTSWRKTFMKIERSAMKDDYREDWDLPDGRSLRVVGRPHPSGTVVFLFEDVTNVLAMERRFRAQISNLENIINTTATGLVAFDRTGKVIFQNNTMKRIVGADNDSNSIQEFSCFMQAVFHPTPIWGDLRQYVEETERSAWQASVETQTGETVLVNVEPMPTGDTLCEFHFLIKINQDTCDGLACAAQ